MCWTARYSATHLANMTLTLDKNERYGVQGMSHRVSLTPGPKPRRGPNRINNVDLPPYSRPDRRTVRARSSRTTTGHHALKRPLNVLQWNAEGVLKKKVPLIKKLCEEQNRHSLHSEDQLESITQVQNHRLRNNPTRPRRTQRWSTNSD